MGGGKGGKMRDVGGDVGLAGCEGRHDGSGEGPLEAGAASGGGGVEGPETPDCSRVGRGGCRLPPPWTPGSKPWAQPCEPRTAGPVTRACCRMQGLRRPLVRRCGFHRRLRCCCGCDCEHARCRYATWTPGTLQARHAASWRMPSCLMRCHRSPKKTCPGRADDRGDPLTCSGWCTVGWAHGHQMTTRRGANVTGGLGGCMLAWSGGPVCSGKSQDVVCCSKRASGRTQALQGAAARECSLLWVLSMPCAKVALRRSRSRALC